MDGIDIVSNGSDDESSSNNDNIKTTITKTTSPTTTNNYARPISLKFSSFNNSDDKSDDMKPPDDLMDQKRYAQGFIDALRAVQTSHKFEFNTVSSPVLPQLASGISPITPATNTDLKTIMMSILGSTPIPTSSSGPSFPTLPSPTGLHLDMDELSLKLIAHSVYPTSMPIGPLSDDQSSASSSTHLQSQLTNIEVMNNLITSSTSAASTSRPDKLNLPPQIVLEKSDDSDSGLPETRSGSRSSKERTNGMSLDDQEKKKLERKRARNRQAASKCRQKKMDRIKELEDQVHAEKQRTARLDTEIQQLNVALKNFQRLVASHTTNGCVSPSCRA